jgi:hypothetical protein
MSRITDMIRRGAPDSVQPVGTAISRNRLDISLRERSSHGSAGRARDKSMKAR